MQETAVSILYMDRQRFSMPRMHSRTCHSCTIHRLHFAIDIEPLLCDKQATNTALTRWSAFLRLVSCQILISASVAAMASRVHMQVLLLLFVPVLVGYQLLPRRFELESVYARQLLPDARNIFFACDRHPLVCVGGVFPLICMLLACVATKRRFNRRCNCTFRR